jgi:hypothetical protein
VVPDFLGPAQLEHMRGALDAAVGRAARATSQSRINRAPTRPHVLAIPGT